MSRLDRYMLSVFLPALLVFGGALVAMAMVVDLIVRGADFMRLKVESPVLFVLKFYLVRIPLFVRLTLPAVPLFAAAFAVVRLSRTNELVPVAVAGMSLRRFFAPFLVVGLLCAALIAALEEWVLPPLMPEIAESEAMVTQRDGESYAVILSDDRGNFLYATSYLHGERTMRGGGKRGILLVQVPGGGPLKRVIRCEQAVWDAGRSGWIFTDGVVQNYVDGVRPEEPPEPHRRPKTRADPIPPEGLFVSSGIRPVDIRRGASLANKFVDYKKARKAVEEHPEIPERLTRLTDKFTYPMSALMIMMLGLPFVAGLEHKSQVKGNFLCLLVSAVYLVTYLIGHDFTNREIVPAVVGCWGPTVLFGCLGAAHFGTIRT